MLIAGVDGAACGAVGITGDTSDNDEICALHGITTAGFQPLGSLQVLSYRPFPVPTATPYIGFSSLANLSQHHPSYWLEGPRAHDPTDRFS